MLRTLLEGMRAAGLSLSFLIILCVDRYVLQYWSTYDMLLRKAFVVFNIVVLVLVLSLIKEKRWLWNLLALGAAVVTFFVFVPSF